jgi:hypothetical protein
MTLRYSHICRTNCSFYVDSWICRPFYFSTPEKCEPSIQSEPSKKLLLSSSFRKCEPFPAGYGSHLHIVSLQRSPKRFMILSWEARKGSHIQEKKKCRSQSHMYEAPKWTRRVCAARQFDVSEAMLGERNSRIPSSDALLGGDARRPCSVLPDRNLIWSESSPLTYSHTANIQAKFPSFFLSFCLWKPGQEKSIEV